MKLIERMKEVELDILALLRENGTMSADEIIDSRKHKDVLATGYYKAIAELTKTGFLEEKNNGYRLTKAAFAPPQPSKIQKPEPLEILHEIKVQIVKYEGSEAVLLVNEKKLAFQYVNDMLSAALMANMEMWKHQTKQN